MEKDFTYIDFEMGSDELVAKIVADHQGWSISIAKCIAKAWNMDWQLDGLDGAAFEALIYCAKRFDNKMGIPFRGYAHRRIHEACAAEARQCKRWQYGTNEMSQIECDAREVAFRLFELFPELRDGLLPIEQPENESLTENTLRGSIKHLLASASLLTSFQKTSTDNPEYAVEFRRMFQIIANMDAIHQMILWLIYWQGQSMRAVASDWGLDELAIIREHQSIIEYVSNRMTESRKAKPVPLKIRPKLRKLKIDETNLPFSRFKVASPVVIFLLATAQLLSNTLFANLLG
ncbi:MAG: hypothetical protein IT292_06930 [Deltaproteobacteria bacterium]|nr:hypothetical protein [Deltaproteobacteria bacterium]